MSSGELEHQGAGVLGSFSEHAAADVGEHQGAAVIDDEGPLTDAERARIRALCWCAHAPAAHPQQDARCDVPGCECRGYRPIGTVHVVAPATWRTTL